MDLTSLLIQIFVNIIVLAPVLWISGRLLVGKYKAKFTDAIWIVISGVVLGTLVNYFIHGVLAAAIMLLVWLALIKHFFDCGWLKAFIIVIMAVIIFIGIIVLLAIFGIGILSIAL
ncbi:hypothetical protein KEJ36_04100 [Candidatus Bathyarchaeota archaeon]|nr:hypothetical protein [Candidatus Bathyarchaeota archaeon]MBS7627977.1 hypothetical protein [Candidatus Bathyarchaeota archaeon]